MGMDLYSLPKHKDHLWVSVLDWRFLQALGQNHGWVPLGTVLYRDSQWNGDYNRNEGQQVKHHDAHSWASALDHAESEVQVIDVLSLKERNDWQERVFNKTLITTACTPHVSEFSEADVNLVRFDDDAWRAIYFVEDYTSVFTPKEVLDWFGGKKGEVTAFARFLKRSRGVVIE